MFSSSTLPLTFSKGLVDRHGADGYWGVANHPLPGLVIVVAGGEIHHRCRRPNAWHNACFSTSSSMEELTAEFPMLALNLHQEVATDHHRLELRVIDVGGNDRPNRPRSRSVRTRARPASRDRSKVHLFGDDALSSVVHLAVIAVAVLQAALRSKLGDPWGAPRVGDAPEVRSCRRPRWLSLHLRSRCGAPEPRARL